uniref:growth arrest-specific protein 1-like n=1 Tax=Myxine glutinosa TaxID=7769 RepID=UPI00358EDF0B
MATSPIQQRHRPHHPRRVLSLAVLSTVLCASLHLETARGSPAPGGRPACWEAEIRCLQERPCKLAYNQYLRACEAALRGAGPARDAHGTRCPSHCVHALVRLNETRAGPLLETCECARDPVCAAAKRAIEPCVPRTIPVPGVGDRVGAPFALGCTEARVRCEADPECSVAMGEYLMRCGKLFNGVRCARECRAVIYRMLAIPGAVALGECVCDGVERPFCEVLKANMARLCFDGDEGSGDGEDDDEDEEDEGDWDGEGERGRRRHAGVRTAKGSSWRGERTASAGIADVRPTLWSLLLAILLLWR